MSSERGHHVLKLRGKGNSERIIPLIAPVLNAIQWYRRITQREKLQPEAPLFAPVKNNRTGELEKHLDPSSVFYIVVKTAKEAGITQKISPHSCRATAISHARDRQVPDRAIQEFAGWSTPDMITRYDKRKTLVEKSAALVIHYGPAEKRAPDLSEGSNPGSEPSEEALAPQDLRLQPEGPPTLTVS
jgi:integrase